MSKIEELIQKLCPNGVEYKTLGEISVVLIGEFVRKDKQNDTAMYPVYNGGVSNTGFYDDFNRTANKIIISARGANAGYVNKIHTNFWSGNSCYTIDEINKNVDWMFLFYFLKKQQNNFVGIQQKGGIPAISKKQIEEIIIPIPPIEVQQEIVRILDKFSTLSEKLNRELELRKKQYEYYCEYLITRETGTVKSLKDILLIKNGRDYKHLKEGDIPVYGSGGVMTYVNESTYDKPSVLIPRKGSLDKLYYVDTPFWNVDTVFYTEIKTDIIVPKYLYYSLRLQHLEKLNNAGGVPSLTQSVLKNVCVLVPPIDEQKHIVSILDKFETLINDQEKGLPAEIRKVQQQYEYYRDKLLTF